MLHYAARSGEALYAYGEANVRPTLAWANTQAFSLSRDGGPAATSPVQSQPSTIVAAVASAVLDLLVAPVQANEPGCDGLHWLDGTVLRFCCDVHDRCYEKYGCSSRSWWQFWSSWTCDLCNAGEVFCFAGGGNGRGPFHPFPF